MANLLSEGFPGKSTANISFKACSHLLTSWVGCELTNTWVGISVSTARACRGVANLKISAIHKVRWGGTLVQGFYNCSPSHCQCYLMLLSLVNCLCAQKFWPTHRLQLAKRLAADTADTVLFIQPTGKPVPSVMREASLGGWVTAEVFRNELHQPTPSERCIGPVSLGMNCTSSLYLLTWCLRLWPN